MKIRRRRAVEEYNVEMLERFSIIDASEYLFEDVVETLHNVEILTDLINRYAQYGIFYSEKYYNLKLVYFSLNKEECLDLLAIYMHKKNYAWRYNHGTTDVLKFKTIGYIAPYDCEEDEY